MNKCSVHSLNVHLMEPLEQAPLVSRWKEVVRHCFKLGFEFNKDVLRLVSGKPNVELALNVVKLARLWMNFTVAHSERGRGLKPKWAAQVCASYEYSNKRPISYYFIFSNFYLRDLNFWLQLASLILLVICQMKNSTNLKNLSVSVYIILLVPYIRIPNCKLHNQFAAFPSQPVLNLNVV